MKYKNMSITTVDEFCSSNAKDDAKRSEGLVTPDNIQRFDNILYKNKLFRCISSQKSQQ